VLAIGLAVPCGPQVTAAETATPAAVHKIQKPTDPLYIWHKQMLAGRNLSAAKLRALADALDGLAAFRYAERLEESGDPALRSAAVHYYSIAVYTGRGFATKQLVRLLEDPALQLTRSDQKGALDALTRQATAGNAVAAVALSRMYGTGRPFGSDPAARQFWLERAAEAGDEDAALALALVAMLPADGSRPDRLAAARALGLLAASDSPGKRAMAQTLLARLARLAQMPPPARPANPNPPGVTQ
jgi:TPR repeat protein